jgi:hypothetical protein
MTGGDQLRVRMLQAGASIGSVILEDGDLGDAWIEAELVMTDLINTKDVSHLRIWHHRHGQGVIGRLHDDVVLSESAHRPARPMDGALGQGIGRECRKLVRDHARLPSVSVGQAQDLWRRLARVAGAERTLFRKRNSRFGFAMHGHLIGTLGAFGGNHDPLFGHEILAEFRHEETRKGIVCA